MEELLWIIEDELLPLVSLVVLGSGVGEDFFLSFSWCFSLAGSGSFCFSCLLSVSLSRAACFSLASLMILCWCTCQSLRQLQIGDIMTYHEGIGSHLVSNFLAAFEDICKGEFGRNVGSHFEK